MRCRDATSDASTASGASVSSTASRNSGATSAARVASCSARMYAAPDSNSCRSGRARGAVGGDLQRHLHLVAILVQHAPPSIDVRARTSPSRRRAVRGEAVADGDERGAIEQRRARFRDAQQQIAVAERLVIVDRHRR